jgi:Tetracyclin repressor-like, C-terminal domain
MSRGVSGLAHGGNRRPAAPDRPPPPSRGDLVALARRRFLRGERLGVEELAAELAVSRATAYRWAGNAEQLAGLVIASLAEDTFRRALREARGRGAARVVDVMARGMRYVATSEAYRAFVERDPQKALRIVASKDGPVQQRTIALHEELLAEEVRRGALTLPVDAHTMAYALVRIVESFLYADAIAGETPDLEKAVDIVKLLLR